MKAGRMIAWLLAIAMIVCLAACGNGESTAPAAQTEAKTEAAQTQAAQAEAPAAETQAAAAPAAETEAAAAPAAETEAAPAAETEAAPAAEPAAEPAKEGGFVSDVIPYGNGGTYNVTWDDTAEINMIMLSLAGIPSGLPEVEAAINEIAEAEIDTHVHIEMVEVGAYMQQVSLKMASNEQVDLLLTFPAGSAGFSVMQAQNQLMDITDLLDTYCPEAKELSADVLPATTIAGRVYAIPLKLDRENGVILNMRKDVLEDLGILDQAMKISCMKDLEAVMEIIHSSEKWSYLSCLASDAGNGCVVVNGANLWGIDSADDTRVYDAVITDLLCVDPTGQDLTVQFIPMMEQYQEIVKLGHEWYEKGYLYKDAATDETRAQEMVKGDKCFGYLSNSASIGVQANATRVCGREMVCIKIIDCPVTTAGVTKFTWAVPITAKYPEAALTFVNMMFTDARINNLMAYGIEGRDYVVDEEGIAHLPEGVTQAAYTGANFILGNKFLLYPWEGMAATDQEDAWILNQNLNCSAILGFSFNTSAIETELASVNNVYEEYRMRISSGIPDVSICQEYYDKANASGLETVRAECERQIREWAEVNMK